MKIINNIKKATTYAWRWSNLISSMIVQQLYVNKQGKNINEPLEQWWQRHRNKQEAAQKVWRMQRHRGEIIDWTTCEYKWENKCSMKPLKQQNIMARHLIKSRCWRGVAFLRKTTNLETSMRNLSGRLVGRFNVNAIKRWKLPHEKVKEGKSSKNDGISP